MNFSDALAKADVWPVASVEASSTQITSYEVPKPLDQRLQTSERAAVVYRLREIAESIMAYRVDNIGADAAAQRRVFEFAKSVNVPLIITGADAANPAELDKLAEEFEINVALESKGDPKVVMAALQGRGKRMGVSAHLGGWAQAGIKAVDGLAIVKDKLLHVTAADRNALNARARVVPLGEGGAGVGDFFLAAYRAGLKPLSITVESTRNDRSRHGEEPAGVRARDVAGDVGARERHAQDPGRPDSRRRPARRRDARAD